MKAGECAGCGKPLPYNRAGVFCSQACAEGGVKIDNKHRSANWERVAAEFQSERDALQGDLYRAREDANALRDEVRDLTVELARRQREAEGFAATLKEVNRIAQAWKQSLIATEAERDALRRDAERYRWLRNNTHSLSLLPVWASPNALYNDDSPAIWDQVIDAALGERHE